MHEDGCKEKQVSSFVRCLYAMQKKVIFISQIVNAIH